MEEKTYYFDNATTSYPKPEEVASEIYNFIKNIGGTYGRVDSKRGNTTTSLVEECRELLAKHLGVKNHSNIIFTSSATRSINDILNGLNLRNTKVLISTLEHNATLRPIYNMHKNGTITYKIIPSYQDGTINIKELQKMLDIKTSIVIINMESNVSGVIQPIQEIKKIIGDKLLLLDATQSMGITQIFSEEWDIDFVAFTGHKGLLGPTGTGGYYVKDPKAITPSYFGGGYGDGYETPYSVPEIFEAGTPNTVGIVGLLAALKNRPKWNITIDDLYETILEIKNMNKYKVICADKKESQGFLFSIIPNYINASDFAYRLYREYNIECRYGFHCAFLAHNFYKNEKGAVRFSFSPYTTKKDLEYLITSLGNAI